MLVLPHLIRSHCDFTIDACRVLKLMGGNVSVETPTTSKKSKLNALHSTLKSSFKRKRSGRDHTKPFRELIRTWPLPDAEKLQKEFDADLYLLKLQEKCDKARKSTRSFSDDFKQYRKIRSDFSLNLRDGEIPQLHQEFLFYRCRKLCDFEVNGLDEFTIEDIESFIEYVYTEKWDKNPEMLEKLRKEFGCTKSLLEDNIEKEKQDSINGDLIITINSEDDSEKEYTIRCDSLIVSSRSEVFHSLNSQKNLVFNETIFPKSFARVFIHFLYTDVLDLSLIPSSEVTISSLSEARAIISGKSPDIQLHRALQIMQVAKFFKVEKMVQSCEDIVVKHLTSENCVAVLQWARDGGSKHIEVHAMRLIESEFSKICNSTNLFDLTIDELLDVTTSQFLQATELEILEAIIKWGEHDLLRKLEEREPNVVADTCHSISRRGLKRAELSGDELKDILRPLTMNIRTDYALPPFHNTLTDAYNRGILERTPLRDDLVICTSTSEINPDVHWLRPSEKQAGPRYYKPYHIVLQKHIQMISDQGMVSEAGEVENLKCEKIHFKNLYPEILDNDLFMLAKIRIENEASFEKLPRSFHKIMALEIVKNQVLTELDISAECFECCLLSEINNDTSETLGKDAENVSNSSSCQSIAPDLLPIQI